MQFKLELVIRKGRFLNKLIRLKLATGEFQIKWWNLMNQLQIIAGWADSRFADCDKSCNLTWLARQRYEYEVSHAIAKLQETLREIYDALSVHNSEGHYLRDTGLPAEQYWSYALCSVTPANPLVNRQPP